MKQVPVIRKTNKRYASKFNTDYISFRPVISPEHEVLRDQFVKQADIIKCHLRFNKDDPIPFDAAREYKHAMLRLCDYLDRRGYRMPSPKTRS